VIIKHVLAATDVSYMSKLLGMPITR
jgi:hypothetical protein